MKHDLPTHGVKFSERYWKKLLDEIDSNKDGLISYEEFKTYMLDMNKKSALLKQSYSSMEGTSI